MNVKFIIKMIKVYYLFRIFSANRFGVLTPLFLKASKSLTPVFTPMTGSNNVLSNMKKKIRLMITMFCSECVW